MPPSRSSAHQKHQYRPCSSMTCILCWLVACTKGSAVAGSGAPDTSLTVPEFVPFRSRLKSQCQHFKQRSEVQSGKQKRLTRIQRAHLESIAIDDQRRALFRSSHSQLDRPLVAVPISCWPSVVSQLAHHRLRNRNLAKTQRDLSFQKKTQL